MRDITSVRDIERNVVKDNGHVISLGPSLAFVKR